MHEPVYGQVGGLSRSHPSFLLGTTCAFRPQGRHRAGGGQFGQQGVLEKVSHANWAPPIVAVPKSDGTVCLCVVRCVVCSTWR